MKNITYEVKKGKIYNKVGLPELPRWFCDERLTVQNDRYGITEVQYFSSQTKGHVCVFTADMWGGMKFFIDENGHKSYLDLYDVEVMPFGFTATWKYKENIFRYEQRIVKDTVLFIIKPVSVQDKGLKFSVEFYDSFGLITRNVGNMRYKIKDLREWSTWEKEENVFYNFYKESGKEVYIALSGTEEMEYVFRRIGFTKNILNFGEISEKEVAVGMSFDNSKELVFERLADVLQNYKAYAAEQDDRYEVVLNKAPVLQSPYPRLNDFFALAPVYHESFKISEWEGAIRARTNMYWAWGWDGMSDGQAYSYWGDKEHIGHILNFYMQTADPEKGIAHCFHRDMTHRMPSPISAQGFYITTMYNYLLNGGDITPYYEFAKSIFNAILAKEVGNLGLCSGNSLVPDFLDVILETGNDISTFNNTNAYCAVRSMEECAKALGDMETAERAATFAAKTRANFDRILFDDEVGYYVSSADSITLEQRKVYMGMELKWENNFCREILGKTQDRCLNYFENNLVCKAGLRVFPVNGIGWDADGNQGRCWWPAHSEYYTRSVNHANRTDLMEQFIGWISNWTEILTCPEGINCYVDTDELFLDNWNSEKGTWQAFSMRAWYNAILHNFVGVDFDKNGVNFYPCSGEEMSVLGLHYQDKTVDVHMKGKGTKIAEILVDGKSVPFENNGIPYSYLKEHSVIIVKRIK